MFRIILAIQISLLFVGCAEFERSCGENIRLKHFKLQEKSLDFISYSANEKLVFENQNGKEIIYNFESEDEHSDLPYHINTLCDEGWLDQQTEYFGYESKSIKFSSTESDDFIRLVLGLGVSSDEDIDKKIVYNVLAVHGKVESMETISTANIITSFHQNEPAEESEFTHYDQAKIIGDTLVNNHLYREVYKFKNHEDVSIFYTKQDGLFFVTDENENYIRLKK